MLARLGLGATTTPPPIDSLEKLWRTYNESHGMHRIPEDAIYYERHLPPRDGSTQLRLLEIGVQSGGSARAWKRWFRSRLYYVGVDVEPRCKRTESPTESMYVEIGSQYNRTFLGEVCRKHGPFDIVIDDGAHRPESIRASLQALFPEKAACMSLPSLYVLEDMHTMVQSRYQPHQNSPQDMLDVVGEAYWAMHHRHYDVRSWRPDAYGKGQPTHPIFGTLAREVHLYESIAFIVRDHERARSRELHRGSDFFAYGKGHPAKQIVAARHAATRGGSGSEGLLHAGGARGESSVA